MSDYCSAGTGQALHIAVVGTGAAAFSAAIKAVDRGATVTMIEGGELIGGTCVNVGCIPSKIMIRAAHIAGLQQRHNVKGLSLNVPAIDRRLMLKQQQAMVAELRYEKYESILQSNPGITLLQGMARFRDVSTLIIKNKDGNETMVSADRILLACGSRPNIPDITGLAATPYWTSTEALQAEKLPDHLVVLGGSVVALELAQAFLNLGVKVTLLARSTLLSRDDESIGITLKSILENEGMSIRLHTVPDNIDFDDGIFVLRTGAGIIKCDQLLVATGRTSNADSLALENTGVITAENGDILTDDYMRTSVRHIYAAGDCTNQPRYVYVAAAAGSCAALNMTGENKPVDLAVIPEVVFTDPQVATAGLSEQQALARGMDVISRRLDLKHVPRAIANLDTRGFIKLVADRESGCIVGCQIVADQASEIIQTATLVIKQRMTVSDLSQEMFAYLTMAEGLKLTAQSFSRNIDQLSCCAA